MTDVNSLSTGGIPEEFWIVPEEFISDDSLRLLHADACSRLRHENQDADVLELMLIERVTSLYFYMRSKEGAGQINSDAAYKSMIQLWVAMAADLRKTRVNAVDQNAVRDSVTRDILQAVMGALSGIEPEVAGTIKRRIAERVGVI